MDVSAVILNKILTEQNIEIYSKLKLVYLNPAYSTLYSVITSHYEKYDVIPTFDDLEMTVREGQVSRTLASVKLLEVPDVPSEVVLDALIDQYTQNETIKLLDDFIGKLPLYDSDEIKNNLANMSLVIEEKTHTSELVYDMSDLMVFQHQEDIDKERIYLGLNNEFDAAIGGLARQEAMFIGGRRGAGKSIVSSNIFVNQYLKGNSSIYFSIEMTAAETHQRHMSIMSGVPLKKIKQNTLSPTDILKLAKVRADMFEGGEKALENFEVHNNRFKFEQDLVKNYTLKQDNQMVIVDDRNLTIGAIDLHIGKAKSKFGDKLGIVVVDYINQIYIEGNQFDWQPQVEISKKLKSLARKYEVAIVSPYQIDASGEARFAKGILDAADISLVLEAGEGSISFESTKMRGAPKISFTCPVDWETVSISPQSIEKPESKIKRAKSKSKTEAQTGEESIDIPWDT
jgi:replicative DNA helicase